MEQGTETDLIPADFYKAATGHDWTGRVDGYAADQLRWHQRMEFLNLASPLPKDLQGGTALLGFACDEGVGRNQGRRGAVAGPAGIRKACASLPLQTQDTIWDAGDILCPRGDLETATLHLSGAVERLLRAGLFSILLGGGHEISYGHFTGIQAAFPEERIGIINLDAHFDLRTPGEEGVSSGTGFHQIADHCRARQHAFHYMALGIQRAGNTAELFKKADGLGVDYMLDRELEFAGPETVQGRIQAFSARVDRIYLSLDLDVFSAAFAPGVSAQNPSGLMPGIMLDTILQTVLRTGKLVSMDLAEYCPRLDIDSRTAKLAASILFDMLSPAQPVGFSDPGRH